jgi:septal ring factor EnvC (AmiA/AmiB activator)
VADIANLEAERGLLEAASDLLHTLAGQLTTLEATLDQTERDLRERNQDQARNEEKQAQAHALLAGLPGKVWRRLEAAARLLRFPQLEAMRAGVG